MCLRELSAENKSPDHGHWLAVPGIEKLMHVPQPYAGLETAVTRKYNYLSDSNSRLGVTTDMNKYENDFHN